MFARFGITEATYKAFLKANQQAGSKTVKDQLAPAADMLDIAIAIGDASQEIQKKGGKQAVAPLPEMIDKFLNMAASWVAAEVALGVTAPDQPIVDKPGDLIRRMYLLLYSSDFRKHPARGDFDEVAWNALLKAVNAGKSSFDDLLPHCRTLCSAVATEFTLSLWPWIW
jgi:hypothetical protein